MPHETPLIATIAIGLALAFLFGMAAARFGLPPLVGYLLGGIAVGPFTPGFVADAELAAELAEIGVILLMFGVGMHFSIRDLLAVRKIALPGAAVQITVATLLGMGLSHLWGWGWGSGLVFGLSLSVASTVVLLKALEERNILDTVDGRIAVGWLIVEDLVCVLALVLLPALAIPLGGVMTGPPIDTTLGISIAITLGKVTAFVALMLVVGRWAVPWLLARVARLGSRELFTLGVLAIALGIAFGAAKLFGVSFALGAFFAGMVISESDLSHQAAADALPLQDAFAVLFFVSVGMLFDPAVLIEQPLAVVAVLLVVLLGKSIAAFGIVLLFRYPVRTALTVSASLAQIGEFSFILIGLGMTYKIVPEEANSLILAGALLSITLNPFVFRLVGPFDHWLRRHPTLLAFLERGNVSKPMLNQTESDTRALHDHAVIIGYGRVGKTIGDALARNRIPYVVVERDRVAVEALQKRGVPALFGDAARPGILGHTHLDTAKLLVVASPGVYETREVIEYARKVNPGIDTVVRTHSAGEEKYFERLNVGRTIMGERELALGMAQYALQSMGRSDSDIDLTIHAIRTEAREAAKAGIVRTQDIL